MASTQVEAASSVHEITDQADEITPRPCCAQGQKPETTTEEPKVDVHDDDEQLFRDDEDKENKEYSATGDELFKDDEDKEYPIPKVADSPAVSEEKTVPSYGNKVNDPEDDDDDDDHDDEDDEEMI